MKESVKVSVEVLNSMAPQRSFVIQSAAKLEDQTFQFHSVLTSDTKKSSDLTTASEDNVFVKAKYINKDSREAFVIPVRQLLNLDSAKDVTSVAEYKAAVDAKTLVAHKVYAGMLEEAETEGEAELPAEFKIVAVAVRTHNNGTKKDVPMYPPYYMKEFNAEVARREEKKLYDDEKGETALSSVYGDFSFMGESSTWKLESRFGADTEALKDITIAVTAK